MRVGYLKNCSALQVPRFEDRNQRLHRRCPKTPSNTEKLAALHHNTVANLWGYFIKFFPVYQFLFAEQSLPLKKKNNSSSSVVLYFSHLWQLCDGCSTAFIIGWRWVIFQFCKREEYLMNQPGMCWCGGAMHPITFMDGCDTHSIFLKVKL